MKAWLVRERDNFCATVVFAETRGKARALAQSCDVCEDARFLEIEVRRVPQMDKYYVEGKKEMYWDTPQDRIALVRDCNFICDLDCFEREECEYCHAKEYCDKYQDILDEERSEGK